MNNQQYMSYRKDPASGWQTNYWKAIHIIARCYDPKDIMTRNSIKCFYETLADIVPSRPLSNAMHNFINMGSDTITLLKESGATSSFFSVYPQILTLIIKSPREFFSYCTQSQDLMFAWTFLLHNYWSKLNGEEEISFNSLQQTCDKNHISKETWGRPMWYIIHHTAAYSPSILNQTWAVAYKSFMYCLHYVLPCPICREHIKENLEKLPIDSYLLTRDSIFEYTWMLHNVVNIMLKKATLTLAQAEALYSMDAQRFVYQNTRGGFRGYHH